MSKWTHAALSRAHSALDGFALQLVDRVPRTLDWRQIWRERVVPAGNLRRLLLDQLLARWISSGAAHRGQRSSKRMQASGQGGWREGRAYCEGYSTAAHAIGCARRCVVSEMVRLITEYRGDMMMSDDIWYQEELACLRDLVMQEIRRGSAGNDVNQQALRAGRTLGDKLRDAGVCAAAWNARHAKEVDRG